MTTFPLATLGCTIDANGISAPSYADILGSLKVSFRLIYGSDAYLEPDSQDGQWLAVLASGFNDTNNGVIAAYHAFSPATAQGAGLSSVVKINGIARQVPSHSTVDVTIVGANGTVINNGQAGDAVGNKWALPAVVNIPPAGTITVTATCASAGAVSAPANSVIKILTPTLGWQTVNNVNPATIGAPVESDANLRRRQANSTAQAALTPLKAITGAVSALPGVLRLAADDNDTSATDANGVPAYSLAMVVQGGDALAIGQQIFAKKGPGAPTYGSTTVSVLDPFGVPKNVYFSRPTPEPIAIEISLHPLTGYTSSVGDAVQQAAVDYINAFAIGDDVITTKLYLPTNLYGGPGSATFEIALIRVKHVGGAFGTADITIAFDQLATAQLADITLLIV